MKNQEIMFWVALGLSFVFGLLPFLVGSDIGLLCLQWMFNGSAVTLSLVNNNLFLSKRKEKIHQSSNDITVRKESS